MTARTHPTPVGAPDPERRTSPILEETDEEFEVLAMETDPLPVCHFNGVEFESGDYVCSSSAELLRCEKGVWVRAGTCDPENQ